ncbi:hypothetical protein [Rhodoligotrophos ferricapiens]|uniref:hypothetical protein n=1 Tax=Rhodoligotrophos ferricapiens TaxID=3069264 RepID=UPI00315CDCD6
MKIALVIFFLTTQSSYLDNTEADATEGAFDTIQFLATDRGAWRIKTYAIDQDVHVWSIAGTPGDIVALARQNTEKHYGDVLAEGYVIETTEGVEGVRSELRKRGLSDHLEIAENGMLFWAPEGTQYRTKSKPQ